MGSHTPTSSPWPLFVALGIAAAEVGVLFGVVPVAVGGVLLFGGSCAGIAREAGLAEGPWRPLQFVGGAIGAASALVWALRSPALAPSALVATATGDAIAVRAAVVLGAAVVLVAGGTVGSLVDAVR